MLLCLILVPFMWTYNVDVGSNILFANAFRMSQKRRKTLHKSSEDHQTNESLA